MEASNGATAAASAKADDASRASKSSDGNATGNGSKPHSAAPQKTIEKLAKTTLLSATTWDIFSPPPSNSFKGKLVPRVVNRFRNRRKLSIEVHKVTPLTEVTDTKGNKKQAHSFEECVVRLLIPNSKQKNAEVRKEAFTKLRLEKGSNETFTSTMEVNATDEDDDEASVVTAGVIVGTGGILADTGGKVFDGWKPRYRFPCQAITIKGQHKKSVFILINVLQVKQERELNFDTLEDATKFCEKLEQERKEEAVRSESRLHGALGDIKLAPFETVTLLIEVVSGWDLPIGDYVSSDPYVICMLGRREVHRTKHVPQTLDPIWTIKNGSLFLLSVESRELFIQDGLQLLVKDFDQFGGNETLGLVKIPPVKLYNATGERMEFKLKPVPGKTEKDTPGYLAIRCRRATDHDKRFMEGYEESSDAVAAAPKHHNAANSTIRSIMTRQYKVDQGVKKFKVRPEADPKRPDETEWMTNDIIQEEVTKPSRFWTDAGTGNLGRVYLEILGCDDLPNLDTGGFLGNKTDAFVSVVYEDIYIRTHTIDDCLSPRWLPWTNRAFILNIGHASSQIFLGVFDYDSGFDDHDLIGRVSVDITNLRKDTDYLLNYNIYPSARVTGRKIQGKVTIRLRLEIPDERKLALSVLDPPYISYVNVKKRKDFRVIRQTIFGKYDVDQYSINTLKSYVDELREYQHILFYLEDAVTTLLLWRGHFPLKIGSKELLIPIHSLNAFIVAIVLVEHPQFYPSLCFATIAWVLIAVMGWRRNNPDEWGRCQSYAEIMEKILLGKTRTPPHNIKPFQGFEKAKEALEEWMKRISDAQAKAEREYIEAQEEEQERLKELEEIGDADADISTKVGGGISLDPVKAALHPVQLILGMICGALRFVKHVVYWEEAYFSFWIATGSAILAVGCLFVPWFFIIRWTARIIVWTLFGPWMKLVDVFYVSTLKPETEEEMKAREMREKIERRLATTKAASEARQVRENAKKMKDMKKFMFGKFAMKVPILKQDRYSDRPLPESSASPYEHKALTLAELAMQEAGYNRTRLPGQNLAGDMIPTVETESFTVAPTGKATANPALLSKSAPGGWDKKKSDSTATAYAKIGAVVAAAGVLTFFGVPILASCTESLVGMVQGKYPFADTEAGSGVFGSIRAIFAR